MKIYLSYKQSWIEEKNLKKELEIIRNTLNYLNIENFIWYFDEPWQDYNAKEILNKTKEKIENSDLILCYINYKEKSEGMFLELGISYHLNKPIITFINKNIIENFWSIKWLSDEIILFSDYKDLEEKLIQYFGIDYNRKEIDNIDKQLVYLLAKRLDIVKNIWLAKKKLWLKPLQPERRKQVLKSKIEQGKSLWLSENFIKDIWERIHQEALKIEE